jgi:plastocyanin
MRSALVTTAATVGLLAVMTGCSSSGGDGSNPAPSPNTPVININGQNGTQAFSPNPAAFGGQSIVFKNNDRETHRVILNDGSVDTGDIAPGATSRAVTMPGSGTNYHCTIHEGMIGAVSPTSGGAPPPCEGLYCDGY